MLKIYGIVQSRAFRVLWLAKELGISFEHIPVSTMGAQAQCKEDWYRALNPKARVPTIDDDGFILTESWAINIYLARKYGGPHGPFFPKTPQEEASMLQWAFFAATDLEPPTVKILRNRVVLPAGERSEAEAKQGELEIRAPLAIVESALAKAPYLAGAEFGLSDVMAGGASVSLLGLKYDLTDFPNTRRWLGAMSSRPAFQEAMKMRTK